MFVRNGSNSLGRIVLVMNSRPDEIVPIATAPKAQTAVSAPLPPAAHQRHNAQGGRICSLLGGRLLELPPLRSRGDSCSFSAAIRGRICIEVMTSDRKLKASREGLKWRNYRT